MIRRAVLIYARWLHYQLWGLAPPQPRACEYRRPASITCYRHGERKRPPRHAA